MRKFQRVRSIMHYIVVFEHSNSHQVEIAPKIALELISMLSKLIQYRK